MFPRFFAIFITGLVLVALVSGIASEYEVSAGAPSCAQSSQRVISLTTVNKEGGAVADLRAEDLTLTEEKVSREILKLEHKANEPLAVAIMIDTSASQERTLAGTKLAAQRFVETILRSNKDSAALVSFTSVSHIEQDLTNDLTKLRAAIDRTRFVPPPGYVAGGTIIGPLPTKNPMSAGATAIWDAVRATVDTLPPAADSRRLIILLTDGEDTISKIKLRDAIEHAAANDVAVFSFGIAAGDFYELDRDSLKKLSEQTGGRAFFPKRVADLDAILLETAASLQSRYALSYCAGNQKPSSDPLKIQIEIKPPPLRQSHRLLYPHYGS